MTSKITAFGFEGNEVRTLVIDNEPYFVGNEVADILGYKRPNDAISAHCRGTVKHRISDILIMVTLSYQKMLLLHQKGQR